MIYPLVSIVSLAYNRREKVANLITALRAQTYQPREIILVDNASADGTATLVANEFPEVKLISKPKNIGMVAYNFGLRAAQGEIILVIDDDAIPVDKFWIEKVVSCFQANSKLGVVCCKIRMLDTGETALDNPEFMPVGDPETGYPAAAYNGTGAGIRASVLREVGYYPDYFFRSWLELHLCTRILNAGWEVRYFPTIEVWHDRPSGSINRILTYYGIRNYYLYTWALGPGFFPVIRETIRYIGYMIKCVLRGDVPASLVLRSITDAFKNMRSALKARSPVSMAIWRHLFRIRMGEG